MNFPTLEKYGLTDMAFTCAQCSFCQTGHGACPTHKVKHREVYSGRGKMLLTRSLLQGRIKPSKGLEALRDGVFGCTLCGGCEEVCQVDIPFVEVYQCLRADFLKMGLAPEALNMAKDTMLKTFNINGQPQMDRVEGWSYWHPDEDALLDLLNKEAKVGFFAGCASSFKGVPIQATIATSLILEKAGVDFTMLGEDEWCCGAPMIMTGDFEGAKAFANHNIEAFEKLGVEKIITNCPGCYKMWAHEYHNFLDIGHDFEILYGYQYYQELLDNNKLKLDTPLDMKITYHDGCDAGRNSGFFEEPRKVIEYLPGVEFEELPHNKQNCYCCGSGGVLRAIDNEFALNINKLKVEDIEKTNAEYVISGCPSCVEFMKGQLPESGSDKISMDLTVLVAKAMGLDWDGLEETYS